ncbi:spore gernimation protein [Bacillus sp. MUM 116]|uniref:spore germination protein n=1 Tax=Bacillus sp. MUM 116 TaxID=1678002 RepID=UPI0008F5D132|nr:spore germination protein [Bacillus sp. MUM 116]OIK07652.1 spore gernimation protein [Bacillus sp. MUM 116]
MLPHPKDQITTSQAASIVINAILGTGILTLPRASVDKVQTPDVWITVLIGGLLAILAGIVIVKLGQQFPKKTFYLYSQDIVGKWVGRFLGLLVTGYFIATSGFQIRSLTEVTKFLLLEETPNWAIILPFMLVGLYLIIGGINPIARHFDIILPITVVLFLLAIFLSFKIFEFENLRPVLGAGVIPVLKGVKTTALSFTGPEVMLFLVAFMREPNKAVKAVIVGITIPLILYIITVIMVIGALTADEVVTRTWPTLDLIRSFEISGLIFERFESLILAIWIMQMFTIYTIAHYGAALGLAQIFKKNIHPIMVGLVPVIYLISVIPKNLNDVFKLGDDIGNAALLLFGVMPLLLLIIAKWVRRAP